MHGRTFVLSQAAFIMGRLGLGENEDGNCGVAFASRPLKCKIGGADGARGS